MPKPSLRLVPPPPRPAEGKPLCERRRAEKRAALLARIAEATPSREDVQHFPGGHVWRRFPEHERAVLRAVARREDGMRKAI